MYVEIRTKNKDLSYEIMGKEKKEGVSLSYGEKIVINGMTVTYQGRTFGKTAEVPDVINLAISFASGVAGSFVATWLLNRIQGKAEGLSIDYREVNFDKGEITKIIEAKIKKETK